MYRLSFEDEDDFSLQRPRVQHKQDLTVTDASMSPVSSGSKRSSQEACISAAPCSPKFGRSPGNHPRMQPIWSRQADSRDAQERCVGHLHAGHAIYNGESPVPLTCSLGCTASAVQLLDASGQPAVTAVAVSLAALLLERSAHAPEAATMGSPASHAPVQSCQYSAPPAGDHLATRNGQTAFQSAAHLRGLLVRDPMLRSPWALNCNTHGEARKMLSMSLKCAMEEWQSTAKQHGGRAIMAAVQVDGCVFLCGAGQQLGHVVMCQNGAAVRLEHEQFMGAAMHVDHERDDERAGSFTIRSDVGTDVDITPVVLMPADTFFVMSSSSVHARLTDEVLVSITQGVLEDYSPPYSSGVANAAAREILAAAIEEDLRAPAAVCVLLVPWASGT